MAVKSIETASRILVNSEVVPEQKQKLSRKSTENILFLDFDGVCNSYACGSYLTHRPELYGMDPDNIDRVVEICKKGNARIVISSNWRRYGPDYTFSYNGEAYRNPLADLYELIGNLCKDVLTRDLRKTEAIEEWFHLNRNFDGEYAILDDDPRDAMSTNEKFMERFGSRFWKTDPRFGLTNQIKNSIINLFNGTK